MGTQLLRVQVVPGALQGRDTRLSETPLHTARHGAHACVRLVSCVRAHVHVRVRAVVLLCVRACVRACCRACLRAYVRAYPRLSEAPLHTAQQCACNRCAGTLWPPCSHCIATLYCNCTVQCTASLQSLWQPELTGDVHLYIVMAYIVMAYIVMAFVSAAGVNR